VKHPAPIDEGEYDRQFRLFVRRYGKVPVCTNNHWCRASGFCDSARFGTRRGIKGENHRVHHPSPPMDPSNLFGTAFGTVYPQFVYDDPAHGNERLDFVDIPIGFYEPGSVATEKTHPLHGQDPFQPGEFRRVVELACRYGWTLNLFKHPTHMFMEGSRGRDALQVMLDHVAMLGKKVVHMGTDALCLWWHARARTELVRPGAHRAYEVKTDHPAGVLVKFLEESLPPGAAFELDDRPAQTAGRERRGKTWRFVWVPTGEHRLRIHA
jgi:hypothetical protein